MKEQLPKQVYTNEFRAQDARHQLPVAPNLLEQNFSVTRPDEVWTADIT